MKSCNMTREGGGANCVWGRYYFIFRFYLIHIFEGIYLVSVSSMSWVGPAISANNMKQNLFKKESIFEQRYFPFYVLLLSCYDDMSLWNHHVLEIPQSCKISDDKNAFQEDAYRPQQ